MKFLGLAPTSAADIVTKSYADSVGGGGGADLSAVAQDIVPDAGFSRVLGSITKPWNWLYAWNIKAAGWYFSGNGTPYTTQVIPSPSVTADQSITLPADTTGTLATEAYVLANAGGGTPGAAQVFVQEDDPETTNPSYTGPAVWYILNSAGDVIGKKVRP